MKERETLDVLKELETTKTLVEELKSKLRKQASEVTLTLESNEETNKSIENTENHNRNVVVGVNPASSAPGLILMELKQAKLNLSRTTTDLADIRGSVEVLNKKLEKERISLDKTRERLNRNFSKISSLEEQLNQTKQKLKEAKDENSLGISKELQRLSSEAEQFKKTGEAAQSEVLKAISEIEQTKSQIKTAEIRLIAAKKMKKAARAAEAIALADIKAISGHEKSNSSGITLTYEEYSSLTSKAREAEDLSKTKVIEAMLEVDEANISRGEILKKVEEATEEIKTSKKALEEALNRVEAANKGKLAVEEALRNWRSVSMQKRRSVQNSTKFKNSCISQNRKNQRLFDANGLNLVNDEPAPVLKPTLSIGQILSRKLLLPEEAETGKGAMKRKISLGQMLGKPNGDLASDDKNDGENNVKQFSGKRKKFGFGRFSLLLAKQGKRKKKPTLNLR